MGIRYYAYAFEAEHTEQALADPHRFLSADPLADAWGMEPGARIGHPTFVQAVAERDMLYLDKAWWHLQRLSAPDRVWGTARPAFRMFEGEVTEHDLGWTPWMRTLTPDEMPAISLDLEALACAPRVLVADIAEEWVWRMGASERDSDAEVAYVMQFLTRAHTFVSGLAQEGRGMVYMIG
ncbi:DUF1877 domain-containing protein [Pseudactinotalea sp. HY158]|uniref:DUF1877 domain-containing protein n=1 Tax=Pseudactinotalea sp. HY158 TaxID=2654547 RepID=UPI00129C5169|nr:DUF1877 domain-containing protein [Pseudactinotalea sp. HY158]QGH68724.1 DUF1877 domain-containing protein [Pseudactinotalea sp. HY158]